MKFDRRPRYGNFVWTQRRLAAASTRGERARARDFERYPLIADQFDQPQPFDADAEARLREERTRAGEQRMRNLHARVWREARRDARAATSEQQETIRAAWAAWRGPLTSLYFRYVVDVHTGVIERRREAFNCRVRAAHEARMRALRAQATLPLHENSPLAATDATSTIEKESP